MEELRRQQKVKQGHEGAEGSEDTRHRHGHLLRLLGSVLRDELSLWSLQTR